MNKFRITFEDWIAPLAIWLLIALCACQIGCATKQLPTLAAAQDVIYGLKKSWTAHVKSEYQKINKLPAEDQIPLRDKLRAKNEKVIAIANKVDAIWWNAWNAAKADSKSKPSKELVSAMAELKLATQ
jgi:hypothetical protein